MSVGIKIGCKGAGAVVAPAGAPLPPCRHLGRPTGGLAEGVQLRFCAPHGACTESRPVEGAACCATCAERAPPAR